MGLSKADHKLTKLFTGAGVELSAPVDAGALQQCEADAQAWQFGFDPVENRALYETG